MKRIYYIYNFTSNSPGYLIDGNKKIQLSKKDLPSLKEQINRVCAYTINRDANLMIEKKSMGSMIMEELSSNGFSGVSDEGEYGAFYYRE